MGGEICDPHGICITAPQYGCKVNHDCPEGTICEHNICVTGNIYGCGSTDDCPIGEVCGPHAICVSATCMVNHDCPIEEPICENNICVNGTLPLGCGSTDDCPKGEICSHHGMCITQPPLQSQIPQKRYLTLGCMTNHDCPLNEPICSDQHICVEGVVPYPCNTTSECPQMTTCGWDLLSIKDAQDIMVFHHGSTAQSTMTVRLSTHHGDATRRSDIVATIKCKWAA